LRARGWAVVAHACWQTGELCAVREALEHAEAALVEAGYSTKRLGFRRLMAAFRLTEQRLQQASTLLQGGVELLLGSLFPQPETAPRRRRAPRQHPDETEN
ncbi:MAG: hypothetical protein ACRD2T_01660, partial [Thermoanaerobaculia bacterium]